MVGRKIKLLHYLFFIVYISYHSNSQTLIKGVVLNLNNKIPFANIEIKRDSISYPIYLYCDENGFFEIKNNSQKIHLKISALGFYSKNIVLEIKKTDITKLIKISLKEKVTSLEEVVIRTQKSLIQKKDTIRFRTNYFTNGTEQTVEDLLKKIPGLQVDSEGIIKVGNQEIEKLMVDGDDLFEKGYKILSKNMPSYPIEEVEILKNYSNNRLLKNIEHSNKVALNLKLNEKSKRIWFGNVTTALGTTNFYEFKGNLMNFGKKNKYFFLTNLNSVGYNATGDIEHLIRPFRANEPASIGDNQKVNNLINKSAFVNSFKRDKTSFNNAELASLNAIFNPTKKIKIKTLGFFNWDETDFYRNSTETVHTNSINFTNKENYQLRKKKTIGFGKLDIVYNISKTKMLETTTKYNDASFTDASNLVFNSKSTVENLRTSNTLFDQKVTYSNKFTKKKVLLLTGRFINESAPQNYQINQFFYQDLFPNFQKIKEVKQNIKNQMQFIGFNAHLLDRKEKGNLLELQIGNEYRKDQLFSNFLLLINSNNIISPNDYQNIINYTTNNLYVKSSYQLKTKKGISVVGSLSFHQLVNQLKSKTAKQNQTPFFVNPSVGMEWEINKKNKITSSYSYNTTNAKVLDVFDNYILTNTRLFNKGIGGFNLLSSSRIFLNYELGNWSNRFFANTFLLYNKNHDFFSTNSQLNQNFTLSEKIKIKDREFLSVNSKIDYYFKFISSNLKLDLGYTKSLYKNIINNSSLRKVKSKNYNYGLELRSGFRGFFNYHVGTKWLTNKITTTIQNSFTDNISFLDLSFIINYKIDAHFQTESYFFGNLKTENRYNFLDFTINYKLIDNKLTLKLSGKNIFNTKTFRNFSISDIGSSTTEYKLRPRVILLKMEYRF